MAQIANTETCIATSSGLAAITAAHAGPGRHILVSAGVYGPTRVFCETELIPSDTDVEYFDHDAGISALLRDTTRKRHLLSIPRPDTSDTTAHTAICRLILHSCPFDGSSDRPEDIDRFAAMRQEHLANGCSVPLSALRAAAEFGGVLRASVAARRSLTVHQRVLPALVIRAPTLPRRRNRTTVTPENLPVLTRGGPRPGVANFGRGPPPLHHPLVGRRATADR
ncbi:PLP-dependent transferase [Streptomyces sp. CA-288835]|uniref:PLP-dependent transferase n=1 Tax=Streptomyces sp. CA-288835 TaxID=3240069 RepID=UPI003D9222AB